MGLCSAGWALHSPRSVGRECRIREEKTWRKREKIPPSCCALPASFSDDVGAKLLELPKNRQFLNNVLSEREEMGFGNNVGEIG